MAHDRFLRGVGLGMLAGAVVGMVVSPGKEELKQTANKAVQAVGNAADTLSDAISQ
jgi:gas vesicle protein